MQVCNVLHAALWKYSTQKWRKKSPSAHHHTTLLGWTFATKAVLTIGKKLVKQQCPHNMANFGPLAADIGSGVWGTPANFIGFTSWLCYCSDVIHRRPTKLARCLAVSWAGTLYIHFSGALAPWQNFTTCKIHFASKSCIFLHWQHYCTALQQRGQPNIAAWYKEWNYGTFVEGATYIWLGNHYVELRPTF